MTYTEKHIIEVYTRMLEGLNDSSKMELINVLSKSLEKGKKPNENKFYRSFGAFGSNRPAEEIIKNIRASRKFRKKDLQL